MSLLTNAFDTSLWSFAIPIGATDGSGVDFSLGITTAAFRDTRANGDVIATATTLDGTLSFVQASGGVPAYFAVDLPPAKRNGFTVPRPTAVAFDLQWAADPAQPNLRTMLGRESILVHPNTNSTGPTGDAQSPVLRPAQPYDGRVVSAPIVVGPQGPVDTAYTTAQITALKGGADTAHDTLKKLGDLISALGITSIAGLQAALAGKATPADISTAVATLTAGSPAQLDTFLETYNRFLADESALSALTTLVGQKAAQADLLAHTASTTNPHGVTKTQVGLGNVANLAPADLPLSTAQAAAIATAVAGILNGADAAHDTLGEIQALLNADEATLASLLTAVGNRLIAASNLSDLTDKAAARVNLGVSSREEAFAYTLLIG